MLPLVDLTAGEPLGEQLIGNEDRVSPLPGFAGVWFNYRNTAIPPAMSTAYNTTVLTIITT